MVAAWKKLKAHYPQHVMQRDLLTVPDVALRFALGEDTVYRLVKARKLPHYRIGRRVRFRADLIDTWFTEEIRRQTNWRESWREARWIEPGQGNAAYFKTKGSEPCSPSDSSSSGS